MKQFTGMIILFAVIAAGLPLRAEADDDVNIFLLKVHLVDRDFLTPADTFSSVHFRAGPVKLKGKNTSKRELAVYLLDNTEHEVSIKAVAQDGRVAYDKRTVRYVYEEDPDKDRTYEVVMVLDFQEPESSEDEDGDSTGEQAKEETRQEEGPSFEGLERTPEGAGSSDNPWSDSVEEAGGERSSEQPDKQSGQKNPWSDAVEEASAEDKTRNETTGDVADESEAIGEMEPADDPPAIPREKEQEIEERRWREIPDGERRIILSGYELRQGDPDDWSSRAVIDPDHVVVAVQYPNGESRVLDGEAALAAMRERGFLEEGSYELTPLGRKGWEHPHPEKEEEEESQAKDLSVAIRASATHLETGEQVSLTPTTSGGHAPYRYTWSATGKGFFSRAEKVTLSWRQPGKKEVSVSVLDDHLQKKQASILITVIPKKEETDVRGGLRLVDRLTVRPNAPPVSSLRLKKGTSYLIEISGVVTVTYIYAYGQQKAVYHYDPVYEIGDTLEHGSLPLGSNVKYNDNQSLTMDLSVLQGKPRRLEPLFDSYNASHVYKVRYKGAGSPLKFYTQLRKNYDKARGHFTVIIYEIE